MFNRRSLLLAGAASVIGAWSIYRSGANAQSHSGSGNAGGVASGAAKGKKTFEIVKSDAEWRKQLTPLQYKVLRKHGTERPFTSPLDKNYKPGIYACVNGTFKLTHLVFLFVALTREGNKRLNRPLPWSSSLSWPALSALVWPRFRRDVYPLGGSFRLRSARRLRDAECGPAWRR